MKCGFSLFVGCKKACLVLAALLTVFTFVPAVYSQDLEVKLVSLTSPASRGDDATIVVTTAPKAGCRISVFYKSGPSKARGLSVKSTDSKGLVSWTWRVGSKTTPGTWPITVNCSHGGKGGGLNTSFVVR